MTCFGLEQGACTSQHTTTTRMSFELQAADRLMQEPIAAVYSSDLQRAVQSAALIAEAKALQVSPALPHCVRGSGARA